MLLHCKDHQSDLQNQSHITVVEALMRVMHEFLMFKAKEQASDQLMQEEKDDGDAQLTDEDEQKPNVSMYYLAAASNRENLSVGKQDTFTENIHKSNKKATSSPTR